MADDFEAKVAPLRAELHAHCYRMLGSVHDADDALQDALLGAWQGYAGFARRAPLRAWLYRIATNACLRLLAKRPRRVLATELSEPTAAGVALAGPAEEVPWLEPYPDDPEASYARRVHVELAYVVALQHLPPMQRAALISCEVLGFSADELADLLGTTTAAVTSALQRARATVTARVPPLSQQATLRALGDPAQLALVTAFADAWARADGPAILALLTEDARFSMPPIPSWFRGHDAIGRFMREQMFATAWRLVPMRANAQLAFACLQGPAFGVGALNVLTLRGDRIAEMTGFLAPAVHARFGLGDR